MTGSRAVAAGIVLCLALAAVPVLAVGAPPIFDYANHLARAHVLAAYEHTPFFQAHFETTSLMIPNVLADVLLLGLMRVVDVLAAGKALLILTFALTVGGALALNRTLSGAWNAWPLLTAAFLYNEMFMWGFLNYDLGLALLLWGLTAWFALEGRARALQLAVAALFGVAIFLAHLVAFGLFGVAIAVCEAHRLWRTRPRPAAAASRLAASALPFVPGLLIFALASPSNGLDLEARFDYSLTGKIRPFARVLSTGNPDLDIAVLAAAAGLVAAAFAARRVACHGPLALTAACYVALVLSLPYSLLGSYFLDSRIVIAAVLVFIAGLHPRRGDARALATALAATLALVAVRSAGLTADWRMQDREYARIRAALAALPPGSVVLTAIGHPFEHGDWYATRYIKPAHEHTSLYATISGDALVPNIFARRGQNPLVFASSLQELNEAAHNPVLRAYSDEDARRLIAQAGAIAAKRKRVEPPIAGVFVAAYHVPCERMAQAAMPVTLMACDDVFSLVEVHDAPSADLVAEDAAAENEEADDEEGDE